ncbi:hypothetical protein A0H81_07309 [Grifola frondosa]|uniref:Uncharacterized protein n=1 Tax=Grifola frondosa TaxID=5627 RepID=A0A1C7M8M3_GRIFR|nr:hypothetical protein A0H81_07309 [Grifola frondosa]
MSSSPAGKSWPLFALFHAVTPVIFNAPAHFVCVPSSLLRRLCVAFSGALAPSQCVIPAPLRYILDVVDSIQVPVLEPFLRRWHLFFLWRQWKPQ